MKKIFTLLLLVVVFISCDNDQEDQKAGTSEEKMTSPIIDSLDKNNDFYDNTPPYRSSGETITVGGETDTTLQFSLDDFPLREVIVREALPTAEGDSFVGAYMYSGVSLYDLLKDVKVHKASDHFKPIIDQYVVITAVDGKKATVSWGEIYYPEVRHDIIIATSVRRIEPSKTREKWPEPQLPKLVIGHDLYDSRNISMPQSISIHSVSQAPVELEMDSLYTSELYLQIANDNTPVVLSPEAFRKYSAPTIFYGRGSGIHGITNFEGYDMAEFLKYFADSRKPENLRNGKVIFHGADGYRAVFTFSEIVNRNDDGKLLWMERQREGGRIRLLPTYDFFSDRAIKSLYKIEFSDLEKIYLSSPS